MNILNVYLISWIKKYAKVTYFIHWKHVDGRKHVRKQNFRSSFSEQDWSVASLLRKTLKEFYYKLYYWFKIREEL